MPTKQEKVEELAKLLLCMAPAFRKNYNVPKASGGKAALSPHQLFCLVILRQNGKTGMSALAEKLGVSNQQLTRIVGELVDGGRAERATDETNRRQIYISLTAKGEQTIRDCFRLACRQLEERVSPLSEEDIDAFIYHMNEIVKLTDKLGG